MSIEEQMLIPSGSARRRFLRDTALAVAAATTIVARAGTPTGKETAQSSHEKCPDVQIPMKDVVNKVAFITGGSSGIGLGIARAFVNAGMKVVIGYRTKSHLDDAMAILGKTDEVRAIRVDVTNREAMEMAAAETVRFFGKVHVLVNNAGVVLPPTLSETGPKDWDWVLDVNLNGPFNGIRAFLPLIRSHGEGGQIITTSSAMGLFAMSAGGAYTVSKYAVVGMMEALRAELFGTNIGVSVFCPGMVDSNIEESSFRNRPAQSTVKDDPQLIEQMKKARKNREIAMDPLEAGQLVLRGMCNNDLYIFTHPEYEQIMQDRHEAMMSSIPRDLRPSEKRIAGVRSAFGTSIYTIQRDHNFCTRTARAQVKE